MCSRHNEIEAAAAAAWVRVFVCSHYLCTLFVELIVLILLLSDDQHLIFIYFLLF